MNTMLSELSRATKITILAVAFLQGCLLLVLHRLLDTKTWPAEEPLWLYLLFTIVIVLPTTLIVILRDTVDRRPWLFVLAYGFVLALLSSYSGYQCVPIDEVPCRGVVPVYVATIGVCWFIVVLFVQTWLETRDYSFPYSRLYDYSWHNYLTLKLVVVFLGLFWGILWLWAALFDVLNISFFEELFGEDWFIYPVSGFVAGLGVVVFRSQLNAVETIRKILYALMRILLPLLSLVSILFLAALPFSGLTPLWETGKGTTLLLWLIALVLFFTNAVYQDDATSANRPYTLWLHRVIQGAMLVLVFFTAFCIYGIGLRVDQYGWTVNRLWGMTITLMLSGFVWIYAIAIVRKRDAWLDWLKPANTGMALLVALICLGVNSPILDFKKISVKSQLARLESSRVTVDKFDYRYFARYLGRPGFLALGQLKENPLVANDPKASKQIDDAINNAKYRHTLAPKVVKRRDQLLQYVRVFPETGNLPHEFEDTLFKKVENNHRCTIDDTSCYVVQLNVDASADSEYLFIYSGDSWINVTLFYEEDSQWKSQGFRGGSGKLDVVGIVTALENGDFGVQKPRWDDVYIGKHRFSIP